MPVDSGKMTFEQTPKRNKGSDCQVPYNLMKSITWI